MSRGCFLGDDLSKTPSLTLELPFTTSKIRTLRLNPTTVITTEEQSIIIGSDGLSESREVDDGELEKTINYSLIDNNFQRDRCVRIADYLSREVEGRDNTFWAATLSGQYKSTRSAKPVVDYNLGRRASYVVAKSVLSSKNSPVLENKLAKRAIQL